MQRVPFWPASIGAGGKDRTGALNLLSENNQPKQLCSLYHGAARVTSYFHQGRKSKSGKYTVYYTEITSWVLSVEYVQPQSIFHHRASTGTDGMKERIVGIFHSDSLGFRRRD